MLLSTLLVAAVLAAGSEPGLDLRVVIEPHAKGLSAGNLVVTARSAQGTGELLSARPNQDLRATLHVPRRGNWILTCQGEGWWCPRLEVGVYDPHGEQALPVFRASRAAGRIQVPRGLVAPQTLTLQGRLEFAGKPIELVETVAVSRGRFQLDLPRDTIDLRSAAPGWTPHYWWSLDCRGAELDLGTIVLRAGSSVSGLVVDSETERPQVGVRATLVLKTDLDQEKRTRLRAASLQAISDARGFFQIAGLEPGKYELELRRSEEPEAFIDTVEVPPDAEVYLGKITRRKPVSVTFEVRPPRDASEARWGIVLRPLVQRTPGTRSERVLKVDRDGKAAIKNLNPASYEILVIDSTDSRFLRTEMELDADTHLTLDVPLVEVEGEVLLGGRPLSASVALHAMESDQVDFTSDTDGRFRGWMRRPSGTLIVAQIRSAAPQVQREVWIKDVHEESGRLRLELRLEDFTIRGRVVDEEGRPVVPARVDADSLLERSSAAVDEVGRFELRGLAGARYQVVARRGDRPEMAPQEIELSEDLPSREILLILANGRALEGRILSAEGQPVPGAGVLVDVLGQAPAEREAPTELDGSFRLNVPEDAASAHVAVLSRALPLFAKCISLPQEKEELTIRLAPLPAVSLDLRVPDETAGDPPEQGAAGWVIYNGDGGVFAVAQLANWEFQGAGHLAPAQRSTSGSQRRLATVTGLPSGSYALTRSSLPWGVFVSQTCMAGPPAGLAWTAVVAGDTATISYVSPAANPAH